jgi:hypothetical protein
MEVEARRVREQGTRASAFDAQREALLRIGKGTELEIELFEPIGESDEFGHGKNREDWRHDDAPRADHGLKAAESGLASVNM